MRDVYFTYALAAMIAVGTAAYFVRIATRGVARSERVGRIGGTALVGQNVMEGTYWMIEPLVRGLVALGVSANGLTWSALVLGLGAGVALGFGWFGLATLLATLSTVGDILDGQVARLTNSGSSKGELLDAAIDRYTEFAFLGGLAIYFHADVRWLALVLATLLACFMVSYASAKAEAMQVTPPRGLMRRHERATYLITSAGLTALFGQQLAERTDLPPETFALVGLAFVAAIGNLAAIMRLVRIGQALK